MSDFKLSTLLLIFPMFLMMESCKKEEKQEPNDNNNVSSGKVKDIDGNEYGIVTIGEQDWLASNLRTTRFSNGDEIPNVKLDSVWESLVSGAWAHYDNDETYENPYGKLYNWFTISDQRNVCPTGWRVPTAEDWEVLMDYLGGESVAGGKLKMEGTEHWQSASGAVTNSSGFSALPGGTRLKNGGFHDLGGVGAYWSSTETSSSNGRSRFLLSNSIYAEPQSINKGVGMSCRCIKE